VKDAAFARIREDVWTFRCIALIVVGFCLRVISLAPSVGIGVAALGATCVCAGVAILFRDVGLQTEPTRRRIVVRALLGSAEFSFDDIASAEIRPASKETSAVGWISSEKQRYDVVVHRRGAHEVVIRRDLQLAAARRTAGSLTGLTGCAVAESRSIQEEAAPDGAKPQGR
jgi:hypothetical protein